MCGIILILLYLFKCALWDNMWSILEKVSCAAKKNVYSVVAEWNMLVAIKSICSGLVNSDIYLLNLSIYDIGVLMFLTITV